MIACEKSRDSDLAHPVTPVWTDKSWIIQRQNQEVPKPLEHTYGISLKPAFWNPACHLRNCQPTESSSGFDYVMAPSGATAALAGRQSPNVFMTMARWKNWLCRKSWRLICKPHDGVVRTPINLHDNMFLIARKS
jgi:hypothetical protein